MTLYPYEVWKSMFLTKIDEELTEDDLKIKYQDYCKWIMELSYGSGY